MAMRSEDSEAKRRLKASGVVLSLPSSISSPLSESRRQRGRSICRLCPIRLSSVDALCYYPWWADPPLWAVRARQPLQTPRLLRRGSAFSSHLRRIPLPRTRVNNKGAPGLCAPLSVAVCSKTPKVRVGLDQPPVVLLGGLRDALPRGPYCAEGCHERAVLAAQDHYVWVRLVQVVVELGEQWLILHALYSS